ncbi:MAG TPA: chromate resistance protein ChrB domain-containing protein [Gemmatimonadaceae bacterium]
MDPKWLVLIHSLPPKPDYLRVKVRRKLQRIGAIALKNSVYVLPRLDEALEDFQWLRREIVSDGGEAMLLDADFLEGVPIGTLEQMARDERDVEYRALVEAARALTTPSEGDVARLRRQLAEIVRRDHFGSSGRDEAEFALNSLSPPAERAEFAPATPPKGAVWVTRSGVKIDRIASAWLIGKWIDPHAVFRFVAGGNADTPEGEIRFDMFEGGFTHIGDRCTFEVLIDHFGIHDRAVAAIAEIVHDVDCKDAKFGRPEAEGIAALINGIATTVPDDAERLRVGGMLFDQLYASLARAAA